MCSNCSGDDPRPESFALYSTAIAGVARRPADSDGKKRKRYGTGRLLAACINTALTLAILRVRRNRRHKRIIGTVDRGSFVNLNLGTSSGENMAKSRGVQNRENLIEIRVSSDAIIEVFANYGGDENVQAGYGLITQKMSSAWGEHCAERSNLRRRLSGFDGSRRLKYFLACVTFVAVVAFTVWCAVR